MSLVEKALRKLQSAPGSQVRAGEAVARVLDAGSARPVAPSSGPVVSIDLAALRADGLLPAGPQERQIAQQYRQIKRPLIAAAIGRGRQALPNGRLIMIASATPGEGKTFMSINLALSLSLEKDIRVLLVDADLAKPHISRLLGVNEEPGLLDVLRDPKLDIEQVILRTDVPRLSFMPAGIHSEDATELLASARMEEVVSAIAGRGSDQVAVFDSPPLLYTTESHALTQVVGQVVLVVRAGVTSQDVLLDALSHIGEGPAVSLVLNQSATAPPAGYYYRGSAATRETGGG